MNPKSSTASPQSPPPAQDAPPDRLAGRFVECCDCYTICPCWVDDTPDEDHCSGLYLWQFDAGSAIDGEPLARRCVAFAAYHGSGRTTQSVMLIDHRIAPAARDSLHGAFTGTRAAPDPSAGRRSAFVGLRQLAPLIGTVLQTMPARFDVEKSASGWSVQIRSMDGDDLVRADGADSPLGTELKKSAFDDEFGLQGNVRVQSMGTLQMALQSLPFGQVRYRGRAGMVGRFLYR